MKKKLITIVLLGLLTFGVSSAHHWHPDYDRSGETFVYDANLAEHQILGTIDTEPNEAWHCQFFVSGRAGRNIVITSDNAPPGLWIDLSNFTFGWWPQLEDVGIYYVNFDLCVATDPNMIVLKDQGTVVIKVQEPVTWEPIGGCMKD